MNISRAFKTYRSAGASVGLAAVLMLAGALFLAGCSADNNSAAVMRRARQAVSSGKYNTAMIELKNLVKHDPKDRAAWLLLGQITLTHGSAADAEADFERARKLGAPADQVLAPLGRALLAQGKAKQVLQQATVDAVSKPALKAKIMVLRGDAYLAAGKAGPAQAAYLDALKFKPGLALAYVGLAREEGASGNLSAAKADLAKAMAKAPDMARAWIVKGELQSHQGKFAAAEKTFKHALASGADSLPPADVFSVRTRIADAQVHQKKYKKALANLTILDKMSPDAPYPKYLRAVIAYQQNNFNTASENLQQILQVSPHNLAAQLLLGAVSYARKNYPQADMYLSNVLGTNPNNTAARKLLSVTLLKEGQPNQAVNVLKQAANDKLSDKQLLGFIRRAAHHKSRKDPRMPDFSAFDQAVGSTSGGGLKGLRQAAELFHTGKTKQGIQTLEHMRSKDSSTGFQRSRLLIFGYLKNHQADKAISEAQTLVKAHPHSSAVHNLLGGVLMAAGRNADAKKAFQQALQIKPKKTSALLNLALLAIRGKHVKEAEDDYKKVLGFAPKNENALMGLARLADSQGHTQEAVNYAEKARAANPSAILPRLTLATYYDRRGQLKKAHRIAQEAVNAAPNQPAALNTLGVTDISLKHYKQAVAHLKQAVKAEPKSPTYRANLGRAEMLLGHDQAARKDLQQVVNEAPDYVPGVGLLSVLEMRTGHKDKALALARKLGNASGDKKTRAVSYRLQGDLLMAAGDPKKAIQPYAQAFKATPSHLLVAKLLDARAAAGMDSADQVAVDWLQTHPKDASLRLMLGQYYLGQKDYAKSTEQFERLAKKYPKNAAILNNLAWLYDQQGNSKALDYAHKAHKLAPEAGQVSDTYGWLLVERGKSQQGIELLEQAAKQSPNNGDIRYHLAEAYVKAGQRQKARKTLKKLLNSKKASDNRGAAKKLYRQLTASR
jgi:putative PEP-CTERM system TPR-repeat lipoprotein